MNNFLPKIIVTSGEPSGIGPDVCLHLLKAKLPARISIIGDSVVFGHRAKQLGLEESLKNLDLISVPTAFPVIAGRLDTKNVPMVLEQLDIAVQACISKQFHAMVTAPVHKGIINDAGHSFTGHTEYLQHKTQTEKPVMMLACEAMRVALVTTHLPLADVPAAITQNTLIRVLEVLYNDLKLRFGITSPCIAVCGLNPHAGEQGHLGRTEIDIIEPTLQLARDSGMDIIGPVPADTAFTPRVLHQVDAVLCMYHDQGLPVLKYASFGQGTNITLGLPIIRTSVDHGTALDLAGTGRADPGSMITAVETAIQMATVEHQRKKRRKNGTSSQAPDVEKESAEDLSPLEEASAAVLSDEEVQDMFNILDDDVKLKRKQDVLEESNIDSTSETYIFREKNEREMEFESTMTETIDKAVKSMKDILT